MIRCAHSLTATWAAAAIALFAPAVLRIAQAQPPSDEDISGWVRDAIDHDPRVHAPNIRVRVESGIVTLAGDVSDLAAKNYADAEAKTIRGVLGVVNKLNVMPAVRSDVEVAHDVRKRILSDSTIESQGIKVASLNGDVTLTGTVATEAEVQQAGLLATEVKGVRSVTNSLEIELNPQRSDEEIRRDAMAKLRRDAYLTGLPITVTVTNGLITLEGSVNSAYQRERAARELEWLWRAKWVVSHLKIEPWESDGVRANAPSPSDAELQSTVRDALVLDPRIAAINIHPTVSHGVVALNGSVPKHRQLAIAEQDALNIVGVAWVDNHLEVRAVKREDTSLREDILSVLASDYELSGLPIRVDVSDGAVSLAGNVPKWFDRTHAAEVVSGILGVRVVVNELTVNPRRTYPDGALANVIQSRLHGNSVTAPVSDSIQLTVRKGVVTLTGRVDTWAQRLEAGHIASTTEGTTTIFNKLSVSGFQYSWEDRAANNESVRAL